MATLTLQPKSNNSGLTVQVRHGKNTILADIQAFTFSTVIFSDGTQLKDATFQQLADQVWSLVAKDTNNALASPTKN